MQIEELSLENIRCFEKTTLRFKERKWVTLLGPNGGGKSTVLQALGLLLAGPEGAQILAPRPIGWLRDENQRGKLSIKIHQSRNDPGQFGSEKVTRSFGYSFFVTGSQRLTIGNKLHTEPGIHASPEKRLTWLRENAFTSKGSGWFGVGYGAFRRLTRKSEIIVPSLDMPVRYTNFFSQFDEDQALSAFERWLVYLDYRIAKNADREAARQKELGIVAINALLPDGVSFDSVNAEGRILFNLGGVKVPTLALSDGYRSVLALSGDLVWRLIQSFPESDNPLKEDGVVLIDELDIHLHPIWQRDIALWLQEQFPYLQFVVATHSPLIAAGAGPNALTLRFSTSDGKAVVDEIADISAYNVDRLLQSEAFGLVSPYSRQTQAKIDRYDELQAQQHQLGKNEREELRQLSLFMDEARPFGGPPAAGSLQSRIENFLDKNLP